MRTNKTRNTILILSPFFSPNIGGVESHLDDLCNCIISKTPYNVQVITYAPLTTKVKAPRCEISHNRRLIIYRIPWIGRGLFHILEKVFPALFIYLAPPLLVYTSLHILLRGRRNIRLIHAHGLIASFVASVISKVYSIKFIVSTHTVYGVKYKRSIIQRIFSYVMRLILSEASKIFALCNASKEELTCIGIPAERIEVYVHWTNTQLFRPFSPLERKMERLQRGIDNKFVVLFVGRLIPIKGVPTLITLAYIIEKIMRIKDITFIIVGEGPLRRLVSKYQKKLNNINFVGRVSVTELVKLYNIADVTMVPSKYEEPFGRVVIESLSCGTPVIVTKRGSLPYLVIDGQTGYISEDNVMSLLHTLLRVYSLFKVGYPDKIRALCREYALRRFGQDNFLIFRMSILEKNVRK